MADSDKAVERELQRLRRLPENRVCPNCLREDRIGFKGVCMAFKTFVCSECKSAHQSFSHRTKSVDMSVWKLEEVKALDERNGGGNRAAQLRWLACVPEGERPTKDSPLEVYKRFVERAYIEKRWAGKDGEGDVSTKDGASEAATTAPSLTGGETTDASGASPLKPRHRRKHRDKSKGRGGGAEAWPDGQRLAAEGFAWPAESPSPPYSTPDSPSSEAPPPPHLQPQPQPEQQYAPGPVPGAWAPQAQAQWLGASGGPPDARRPDRDLSWTTAADVQGPWRSHSPAHSAPAGGDWSGDRGSYASPSALSPASAPAAPRICRPPVDLTNPWMPPIDPTNPWAEALLRQRVAAMVGGRERFN